MKRAISNLNFYRFENILRQLLCRNIKIPCHDKTVALKPKSYVSTFDICVATFKLLVTN